MEDITGGMFVELTTIMKLIVPAIATTKRAAMSGVLERHSLRDWDAFMASWKLALKMHIVSECKGPKGSRPPGAGA
jgi:hypothetical protein